MASTPSVSLDPVNVHYHYLIDLGGMVRVRVPGSSSVNVLWF